MKAGLFVAKRGEVKKIIRLHALRRGAQEYVLSPAYLDARSEMLRELDRRLDGLLERDGRLMSHARNSLRRS
jgi:hypothetical protein